MLKRIGIMLLVLSLSFGSLSFSSKASVITNVVSQNMDTQIISPRGLYTTTMRRDLHWHDDERGYDVGYVILELKYIYNSLTQRGEVQSVRIKEDHIHEDFKATVNPIAEFDYQIVIDITNACPVTWWDENYITRYKYNFGVSSDGKITGLGFISFHFKGGL